MFEGLIEFIESSVFGVINQINEKEENGLLQTQSVSMLLLNFAARNPGMTRVMIGDALVNEDGRLQLRMNQFFDRVELTLRQCYIIGKLFRFVKTQFKENPTGGMQEQINFILS